MNNFSPNAIENTFAEYSQNVFQFMQHKALSVRKLSNQIQHRFSLKLHTLHPSSYLGQRESCFVWQKYYNLLYVFFGQLSVCLRVVTRRASGRFNKTRLNTEIYASCSAGHIGAMPFSKLAKRLHKIQWGTCCICSFTTFPKETPLLMLSQRVPYPSRGLPQMYSWFWSCHATLECHSHLACSQNLSCTTSEDFTFATVLYTQSTQSSRAPYFCSHGTNCPQKAQKSVALRILLDDLSHTKVVECSPSVATSVTRYLVAR